MTTQGGLGGSATFRHVQPVEADRAISTLTLAFASDPHLRWLFPNADTYLASFPDVLRSFARVAFAGDTVWQVEDMGALALWLPPGAGPYTDATIAVFERSVPADKLSALMAVFEQMETAHPQTPHWYLAWIGCDLSRQGLGLGSDLMTRCLQITDADHLPTFLDTPNPMTVRFYQRHGFDVVGEWTAGVCPPVLSMLRPAR